MRWIGYGAAALGLGAAGAVAQEAVAPLGEDFVVTPMVVGPLFAPYSHAMAALAGWALLMMAAAVLSVAKAPRERTPSGLPVRDYADPGYRAHRALGNAMEAAGPFVAATVAAILAGASPFWVNLLASVFLVARVAMLAIHVGTENQPARSATWAVGMICVLGLVLMALWSAFAS